MTAPKEHPLVELIGSCLAADTADEANLLVSKFLVEYEVVNRAEMENMLVAVANRNAAYAAEAKVLREMSNLPNLDELDGLNDITYATEDDL
ncbi:hypothetical protein SEA_OCTOBIEN14_50 [Gordonia phage Octobien14]|uniref:Uncharacterized protein n=1 Tax=Gordonia phage Octobien14 TaxID=2483673 RepID=A0A3G3M9Q7_9CAUD|nr:hypothetical protein L3Y22_gp050 [Gordonia phage Octobien14]AYR03196.1 hypothetical protein SEA_OCTOBIEN14_50 [Gordonia phage Octobien14]